MNTAPPPGGSAMYCLLEMVAIAPDLLAPRMVGQLDWLKVCLCVCLCVCGDGGHCP